ncbi:MAG: hypothetical protein ABIB79_05315 [archaeon]
MKSSVVVVLFILLISCASAVQIVMDLEFDQGETLMAKVSGNFLDQITQDNIAFYRGHVRISLDSGIAKIDDEFYIYALLGDKPENDYSMKIEGVRYMEGSQVSEEDIVADFSISNQTASFSVDPGAVYTHDDFSLKVQNLQNSQIEIDVTTGTEPEENPIFLKSGEIKEIKFKVENVVRPFSETIGLSSGGGSYDIPIYIYMNESGSVKEGELEFDQGELRISMATDSETTRIIYIENNDKGSVEDIELSVSDSLKDYVTLSVDEINELDKGESKKIELKIESSDEEGSVEGQVIAKSENESSAVLIYLTFIKDYVPPVNGGESSSSGGSSTTKTCAEEGGQFCESGYKCDGDIISAVDGSCCLGTCEEDTGYGQLIGWGIIIVIVLFLVWFYLKKYKGAKREVSLFKKKEK